MTHLSDDLPRLLTGEASREDVLSAAAHLRTCVDCQQELVSAVVAHASLMSAQRFAPEVVTGQGGLLDEEPDDAPPDRPLPDLSSVFAQVRNEANTGIRAPRNRRTRLALAAAAAIVIGGGVTAGVLASGGSGGQSPQATRTVRLAAYDRGSVAATAFVEPSAGHVVIDAAALPKLPRQQGYEVWLTDAKRQAMKSIGWIDADGTSALDVSPSTLDHYTDIEVSKQPSHNIAYSGVSVLRGDYS